MAQLLDQFGRPTVPRSVSPFTEVGVSGTPVFGGYIMPKDRHPKLYGSERYRTASEIVANISIVAAGVRYFLNLLANPKWKLDAVDDEDDSEETDFILEVMDDMDTNWNRMVRRSGFYRFHGFGIHEWIAKKRKDGKIGLADIEPRPQHTIERWAVDEKGTVQGVFQRAPQNGKELGLPRSKIIYLVDDTLTDDPQGMGWFRHLVDPSERLKVYLQLEGYGFQRNLSGTPVGRAPLQRIKEAVDKGRITKADGEAMVEGLRAFVKLQAKSPETGIMLDSQPHESMTADGFAVSSVPQWGLELLQGGPDGLDTMGEAISRLTYDMARIMGVENLLTGSEGTGSLALSKDKSRNIYLQVNSTLADMAAQFSKDLIDPLWALNGFDEDKKPKFKTEDVAFKDVEQIAAVLRDMATAGATLQPDDPAIDDVRDLMGISHAPEIDEETLGMMRNQSMGLLPDGTHPLDRELDAANEEAKLAAKKPKPNGFAGKA